ncbi:MAG TPA: CGNR zinc finger domain-containing protein, partial [Nocardioidaceae bacterium]|nr:CGNR zinc finger domain-containing protein [Nocardioidaceae bacterium]
PTSWSPSHAGGSWPPTSTADPMADPKLLIRLANLGRPRRPSGVPLPHVQPVLPAPATASGQLADLVEQPVTEADLAELRRLQRAVVKIPEALAAGEMPDPAELNALAAESRAHAELDVTDGVPRRRLVWTDPSLTAMLARRLIDELDALQPDRLRSCARPECELLFYDTTRSRTRRWHAEDPCGWRERQRAHRRSAAG